MSIAPVRENWLCSYTGSDENFPYEKVEDVARVNREKIRAVGSGLQIRGSEYTLKVRPVLAFIPVDSEYIRSTPLD